MIASLGVTRATPHLVSAIAALLLILNGAAGCSSTPAVDEDANNGIYGAWSGSSADGSLDVRLQLTSDGTYSLTQLTATSATTANARAETGTFAATTSTLTWTPAQSSCSGAAPPYQSAYQLEAKTLSLALPAGVVALQPGAEADDVDGGPTLTLGCYAGDGTFTAAPLAPVSPAGAAGP